MFLKIRKIFKKKAKAEDDDQNVSTERRAADRAKIPDTSDVDEVKLGKGKIRKIKKAPSTKGVNLDLSSSEQKAEEQKKRNLLKKKLKDYGDSAPDDPFGFSIDLPSVKHDEVHQTIAVSLPELGAACKELKKAMRVRDISTTGIGLRYEKPRVKAGTELTLILATKKKKLTTDLKARVMRHEKGILGARFHDLTRQQENLLSKLVLEGQKRQREKRKKRELPKDIQDLKL